MVKRQTYRRGRKRANRNKNFHKGRKMHVARVPRINLKPTACARRVIFRNQLYITNTTEGPPMPWFQVYNLNSPWVINPSSNLSGTGVSGSLSTNSNVVPYSHTNGAAVSAGTSYEGLFDTDSSPGRVYRQICITGCKFSVSFTPQFEQSDVQPAGLATCVISGPNIDITSTSANASLFDDMPYGRVRKILGSQSSLAAQGGLSNTKSAYSVIKYSAKKFNDVKDIKDASQMWANCSQSGNTVIGSHPAEVDRVCVAIVPLLNTPLTSKSLPSGLLEIQMEAVALFREPSSTPGSNVAPLINAEVSGIVM